VKKDGESFQFADPSLKRDKEILEALNLRDLLIIGLFEQLDITI